jgi:hypothetical protein
VLDCKLKLIISDDWVVSEKEAAAHELSEDSYS